MKKDSIANDAVKVVLTVILFVVLLAVAVALIIGVGYVVGMFIAILPFVSDWLTQGTPIDKSQIPTITAWLAVAGMFIGGGSAAKVSKK